MTNPELTINPKQVRIPRPKIKITEEIAERACRRNSRHCMIAEAIKEAMPWVARIMVDLQTIRWSDPRVGLRYIFLTPLAAQKALVRFDAGEPVAPFSFTLRGGRAVSMLSGGGSTGKPQRQVHNLGKQRITSVQKARDNSGIVDVVGGKSPPVLSPRHASNQSERIFGLRAFTGEWVLKK
jgi:hypothetical protein